MTSVGQLHDRLRDNDGYPCTCPNQCDAMLAAELRHKRERQADAGQLELGHAAVTPEGPPDEPMQGDDWGGY
jgi:hypothetical protein